MVHKISNALHRSRKIIDLYENGVKICYLSFSFTNFLQPQKTQMVYTKLFLSNVRNLITIVWKVDCELII